VEPLAAHSNHQLSTRACILAQVAFYAKENGVGAVLKREYELAAAAIRGEPIEPTPGMRDAFPPPPAFWVGLRLYILMAPFTMLAPPIYLISCLSGLPFYFALSVIAFLTISGHRLAQSDAEKVNVRLALHQAGLRVRARPVWRTAFQATELAAVGHLVPRFATYHSPPPRQTLHLFSATAATSPTRWHPCVLGLWTRSFAALRSLSCTRIHTFTQLNLLPSQYRGDSAYTMAPNPIQKLFLMVFLPFWAAATFGGLFSAVTVPRPFLSIALFAAFLFVKNGICMSVILHR
jgi:hypothetical protein